MYVKHTLLGAAILATAVVALPVKGSGDEQAVDSALESSVQHAGIARDVVAAQVKRAFTMSKRDSEVSDEDSDDEGDDDEEGQKSGGQKQGRGVFGLAGDSSDAGSGSKRAERAARYTPAKRDGDDSDNDDDDETEEEGKDDDDDKEDEDQDEESLEDSFKDSLPQGYDKRDKGETDASDEDQQTGTQAELPAYLTKYLGQDGYDFGGDDEHHTSDDDCIASSFSAAACNSSDSNQINIVKDVEVNPEVDVLSFLVGAPPEQDRQLRNGGADRRSYKEIAETGDEEQQKEWEREHPAKSGSDDDCIASSFSATACNSTDSNQINIVKDVTVNPVVPVIAPGAGDNDNDDAAGDADKRKLSGEDQDEEPCDEDEGDHEPEHDPENDPEHGDNEHSSDDDCIGSSFSAAACNSDDSNQINILKDITINPIVPVAAPVAGENDNNGDDDDDAGLPNKRKRDDEDEGVHSSDDDCIASSFSAAACNSEDSNQINIFKDITINPIADVLDTDGPEPMRAWSRPGAVGDMRGDNDNDNDDDDDDSTNGSGDKRKRDGEDQDADNSSSDDDCIGSSFSAASCGGHDNNQINVLKNIEINPQIEVLDLPGIPIIGGSPDKYRTWESTSTTTTTTTRPRQPATTTTWNSWEHTTTTATTTTTITRPRSPATTTSTTSTSTWGAWSTTSMMPKLPVLPLSTDVWEGWMSKASSTTPKSPVQPTTTSSWSVWTTVTTPKAPVTTTTTTTKPIAPVTTTSTTTATTTTTKPVAAVTTTWQHWS